MPKETAINSYSVSASCTEPYGFAYDGSHEWVGCLSTNNVLELSAGGAILHSIAVGSVPSGLAFDGTNIWVANSGSSSLSKINASTLAVTTYSVSSGPNQLAYDTEFVWVVNSLSSGATVEKVLASTGAVVGSFATPANTAGIAFDLSLIHI